MPRLLPILAVALALAAGGLAVAGCGSDDSSSDSPATTAAAPPTTPAEGQEDPATGTGGAAADAGGTQAGATVSVSMKDIAFDPKSVTAKVGDKVEWTNDDDVQHNVVADSGADFKSDIFGKGGTYEYTPETAGTIDYECTLHPGMVGKIIVVK